ncbi:ketoacyl-synthetase C-terminal extension domain-containing protein, partial [Saccharothrix sp. ST-888]|uniref:ketoacyl-synthetase C-terminal extension domain-containing protein n=1 Tax=Saccharothrix sp. ST-888 TaxID=1427391 RepID=UPI0005ED331B
AAGVIKMVQAMQHGVLPKSLHVGEPSSHVDWTVGAVSLLSEAQPWPETGEPRRSAVSSFGFSGTNAHIILEQAPEARTHEAQTSEAPAPEAQPAADEGRTEETPARPAVSSAVPWLLSARSADALRGQAERLFAKVEADAGTGSEVADLGYSLATTRSTFEHRAVLVGHDLAELRPALEALASGEPGAGVVQGVAGAGGKVAFVFPGQGS